MNIKIVIKHMNRIVVLQRTSLTHNVLRKLMFAKMPICKNVKDCIKNYFYFV